MPSFPDAVKLRERVNYIHVNCTILSSYIDVFLQLYWSASPVSICSTDNIFQLFKIMETNFSFLTSSTYGIQIVPSQVAMKQMVDQRCIVSIG